MARKIEDFFACLIPAAETYMGNVDEGTYPDKIFRRFSRLFWPIFDPNLGGHINIPYITPKFGSKIGSKEPENRPKLFIGIGSGGGNQTSKKRAVLMTK